jgi:hypothetical protein
MADSTPKISLSLLDLLFCAFGGVIVMAVIFISIAGTPDSSKSKRSGHLNIAIVQNNEVIDGMAVQVYPDTMQGLYIRDLINDTVSYFGAQFHLYPYGDYYHTDVANNARISFKDYPMDTLRLKLDYENFLGEEYRAKNLQLRIVRFQNAEWDTVYVDFPYNISGFSYTSESKRIKIPLR